VHVSNAEDMATSPVTAEVAPQDGAATEEGGVGHIAGATVGVGVEVGPTVGVGVVEAGVVHGLDLPPPRAQRASHQTGRDPRPMTNRPQSVDQIKIVKAQVRRLQRPEAGVPVPVAVIAEAAVTHRSEPVLVPAEVVAKVGAEVPIEKQARSPPLRRM